MKYLKLNILILIFSLIVTHLQAAQTAKPVTYANGKLDNEIISVAFNLDEGTFSIVDSQSKEALLSDATFGLPSGRRPASVKLLKVEDVKDELGVGKKVILAVNDWNLLRYSDHKKSGRFPAQHLFSYTLYQNSPALVLGFGLKTPEYISMRLMKSQLLSKGQLFGGKPIENLKTLNGAAGAQPTLISSTPSRICVNTTASCLRVR